MSAGAQNVTRPPKYRPSEALEGGKFSTRTQGPSRFAHGVPQWGMERRLPLVLPALCVVGWVVILTAAHATVLMLFWTSVSMILVAVFALKWGSLVTAFHCSCLCLGCLTVQYRASHIVSSSDSFGPTMRVRVEGVVQELKRSSPGQYRYVVSGEVDAMELPCVQARCLVTEWASDTDRKSVV